MAAFWFLFWSGFTVFYLAKTLISNDVFYDDGSGVSGTHIWVRPGSNYKVRDATIREVWRRENPGENWNEHAKKVAVGCSVFLAIIILALLLWFAYRRVFALPGDWLSILTQVGALILGFALAGLLVFWESRIVEYQSEDGEKVHTVAMILLAVCIIAELILTIFRVQFPIFQYWPLFILGALARNLFANGITEKDLQRAAAHKTKAQKAAAQKAATLKNVQQTRTSGDASANLTGWTLNVMGFMNNDYDFNELPRIMNAAVVKLQQGELDSEINDPSFFVETETVYLDEINGNLPAKESPMFHYKRYEVLQAAKIFYLYSVNKFPEFEIHPDIQAAMRRKNQNQCV